MFDPLFFLADSLRRGLGKLLDQLRERGRERERMREKEREREEERDFPGPRSFGVTLVCIVYPLSFPCIRPLVGSRPQRGFHGGGTYGKARSKFRVRVPARGRVEWVSNFSNGVKALSVLLKRRAIQVEISYRSRV